MASPLFIKKSRHKAPHDQATQTQSFGRMSSVIWQDYAISFQDGLLRVIHVESKKSWSTHVTADTCLALSAGQAPDVKIFALFLDDLFRDSSYQVNIVTNSAGCWIDAIVKTRYTQTALKIPLAAETVSESSVLETLFNAQQELIHALQRRVLELEGKRDSLNPSLPARYQFHLATASAGEPVAIRALARGL